MVQVFKVYVWSWLPHIGKVQDQRNLRDFDNLSGKTKNFKIVREDWKLSRKINGLMLDRKKGVLIIKMLSMYNVTGYGNIM